MTLICLSGSGLSAGSGLPTFRGAGGLHAGMRAEEFLSAASYARDPAAVERWHDGLRRAVLAVEPNAAHRALADLERRRPDTVLLTQNVDGLLQRAGAARVVELHGSLHRSRCLGHAHLAPREGDWDPDARCTRCGARLRTDVVLFGEAAPGYATLRSTLRRAGREDVLLVVGTQGVVLPVTDIARAFPGRKLLVNLHASDDIDDDAFDLVVHAPAEEVLEVLVSRE